MPPAPYIKQQKENKEDNEELPMHQSRVILISQSLKDPNLIAPKICSLITWEHAK